MTITEVSEKFGLTADTLRYYERIGLLPPVTRTPGGARNFMEEECNWVSFIKCMRNAGLSIEALVEYVSLFRQGEETIPARKLLLIEQRKQLEKKLTELQSMMDYLDKKIEHYDECIVAAESKLKKFDDE